MAIHTLQTDHLTTQIYASRADMGAAAAAHTAHLIRELLKSKQYINMVFAAAPSQSEMLDSLLKEAIDFSRINAFHMDEYIGLTPGAPQSFTTYLTEHLFDKAPFRSVHLIPASQGGQQACETYSQLLRTYPPDIVCMGIGENGHIAFNDPPVADFNDPALVKVVTLDEVCRLQQVHDGCFPALDDVPEQAITLTIPALMRAAHLVCTVPAITKAAAVKLMLQGYIGTHCPATALRNHPSAFMFLDRDSSSMLGF